MCQDVASPGRSEQESWGRDAASGGGGRSGPGLGQRAVLRDAKNTAHSWECFSESFSSSNFRVKYVRNLFP